MARPRPLYPGSITVLLSRSDREEDSPSRGGGSLPAFSFHRGGLYPVEVYLVCSDIPGPAMSIPDGLRAGVYHFSPADFALRRLRKGDYRGELSDAAGGNHAIAASAATLIFTGMFWRSAWKYQSRSYRYCFWDAGTVVANLLATASAAATPAQLVAAFIDDRVNRLLGIDGKREASLCLVAIGNTEDTNHIPHPLDPGPVSAAQEDTPGEGVDYPAILQIHAASSLTNHEEVAACLGGFTPKSPQSGGVLYPLPAPEGNRVLLGRLGEVILGRGSSRRFARESISYSQLWLILDHSTKGVPAEFLGPSGTSLLEIYVIVNAVDGLPSGSYFFSPQRQGLELLQDGSFRSEAGHLCFEQALGADASAVVFFMSDLDRVLGRYGNRGYRAAQLEAGIRGGKMYLCAYSLGLGASGVTFYDADVTDFFSPHAERKSAMFVIAVGVKAKRNRVRPFRSGISVVLDSLARGGVKRE